MSALREQVLEAFESLEEKRNKLDTRLGVLPEEWLKIPEAEGRWSVNQVLAHLSDAEFGTLRYIGKKINAIDSLKGKDWYSILRYKLLKWLLDSPIRYKMPKQLPEPSNDRSYPELIGQFDKNRAALKDLIHSFPTNNLDKLIFRHPLAGRFSLYQTVRFMEDHYKHHLKQIDRILQAVENRGKS